MTQGTVSKTPGVVGVQKTKKNITKPSRKGAPIKQKMKSGKDKAQQKLGKTINRNIENFICEKALKNGAKLKMLKPEEKGRDSSQQRVKRFKNKINEERKGEKKKKTSMATTISISAPSSSSTSTSSSSSATTSTPSTPSTPRK
jgi:hypothetical protein